MTAKKSDKKNDNVLRTPKPKNKLGLFVPKINLPHSDLVKPEEIIKPSLEMGGNDPSSSTRQTTLTTQTSQSSPPSHTNLDNEAFQTTENEAGGNRDSVINTEQAIDHAGKNEYETIGEVNAARGDITLPGQTSQSSLTSVSRQSRQSSHSGLKKEPIAPERNFQRVPNSIVSLAIPAGIFRGKAKQLYDVLYHLTRGAVVPRRSVRAPKGELMKKAGIGSRITFDTNIEHLQKVGLIKATILPGEHAGNEFEVFTVEEIGSLPSQSSEASLTSQTSPSQKLDSLVNLETSHTRMSLNTDDSDTYEGFKTYFKDHFEIDDEAPIIAFVKMLNEAAYEVTGRNLNSKDLEALPVIAELLIGETSIARAKTKTISSYLKFAAENLRRRLYTKQKTAQQPRNGESTKTFSEPVNSFEAVALGEERELILKSLKSIAEENGKEAVEIFRGNYTEADWLWICEQLQIEK